MRLLNITQKKLSSPCSTNWANMQNTCKWWTKSKSCTAPRCPLHNLFSAKWVNRLLAHSLLKWGQIFINSPEITLSPQNTVFHFGHFQIALNSKYFIKKEQKIPKEGFYSRGLSVKEILCPPTSLPTSKLILLVAEAFLQIILCRIRCWRNTQCSWILLKSLFKRSWRGRH